jgi:hypothetical protein
MKEHLSCDCRHKHSRRKGRDSYHKIKSPKKRKKNSQVYLLSNLVDEFKLTNRLYAANKEINLEIINNMGNTEHESILMKI